MVQLRFLSGAQKNLIKILVYLVDKITVIMLCLVM